MKQWPYVLLNWYTTKLLVKPKVGYCGKITVMHPFEWIIALLECFNLRNTIPTQHSVLGQGDGGTRLSLGLHGLLHNVFPVEEQTKAAESGRGAWWDSSVRRSPRLFQIRRHQYILLLLGGWRLTHGVRGRNHHHLLHVHAHLRGRGHDVISIWQVSISVWWGRKDN